ncbi:hypothetical protein HU200_056038 [Digitaria exilis]|uniref:Expansin-like EG45 domain-containing protein n=1 Tax=Digitaria exilis TaxID=1010633 RepID=A0A835AJG3_9POAL|nr:hypothetical protein HU200_056038 [Digitaria exilis]
MAAAVLVALVIGVSCSIGPRGISGHQHHYQLLQHPVALGEGDLVRPSNRRRARRQRRRVRDQGREPSSLRRHDVVRQPPSLQGRQGLWLLLPDQMHGARVLRPAGGGVHHRHELYGPVAPYYFDLSGTAFGSMARPGLDEHLRHRGIIDLHFRRVPCKYGVGQKIVFHVEAVSNPFYLAVLVKFVAMDGNIVQMELKEMAWPWWQPMRHS